MECQNLFSQKIRKKNYFKCRLLEFLPSMLGIKLQIVHTKDNVPGLTLCEHKCVLAHSITPFVLTPASISCQYQPLKMPKFNSRQFCSKQAQHRDHFLALWLMLPASTMLSLSI